jgi:endonuclease/exonuclease/phosphatase family metal-dependent hydrolase
MLLAIQYLISQNNFVILHFLKLMALKTSNHLYAQNMNKLTQTFIILLLTVTCIKVQAATPQNHPQISQESGLFKFTTWNTEWLSCSINGPMDENLQINNIVSIIKTINSDVVALQEVGTSDIYTTIDTLVMKLGSNEWAGYIINTYKDNCSQNQGIVYKKSKIQLINAAYISNGGSSYDWSNGRFPVLYNVNLLDGANTVPVSFINIHAKAMSDETSYSRRKNASIALKALLDGSAYNSKKIVLLGDFNDYINGTQCSTCVPAESPYKNFADDIVNYKCLSTGLYDPSYASPVIDNIVISNELFEYYKVNSTLREELAAQGILNYYSTTSDHVPVSASFKISTGPYVCENSTYSETFSTGLGEFTPYSVNGSQAWNWRPVYGACVSGYESTINYANEDWIISPVFDLSDKSSASLAFNHALNFCLNESDKINNQTLWISSNYTLGSPANATWTQLTIPIMPVGNNWNYVNSGNIEIPNQMLQKNVRFAFKYLSTSTIAGTWEIKDLTFKTQCVSTDVKSEKEMYRFKVYAIDKLIKIENNQYESITVYDMMGGILFTSPSVQNIEIPIYQPGIYMLRVGKKVNKVFVK